MSGKERQEQVVENMKKWQKIENAAVVSTGKIIEKTDNPLIRLVAETIQRDSQHHYHVQQMIIDSMEKKPLTLQPEDVAEVWDLVKEHIEIEKKTIEFAKEGLDAIKGMKHLTPQHYLMNYLLKDEEKHDEMLEALEKVKRDLYPYA
jgi:pyruvate-formate lyase-activating enzyme